MDTSHPAMSPEQQINKAAAIASSGDTEAAIELLKPLLRNPQYSAVAHNNLGVLYRNINKPRRGYRHFQCALRINQDYSDAIINEANYLFECGDYQAAEQGYKKALGIRGDCPKLLANYGQCLVEQDRIPEALAVLEQATAMSPELITAHYNLARAYMMKGELEPARVLLRRITAEDPRASAVHRILASCTRFTPESSELATLKEAYFRSDKRSHDRMHLAFALGKAYEDIKQPVKAFRYISIANCIHRQFRPYNSELQKARFSSNINLFNRAFFQDPFANAIQSNQRIIFLIGLPRCGSTLIHQILSMHPSVKACGESTALGDAILRERGVDLLSDPHALARIRDAYLDAHQHQRGVLVDKNLYNFYWVPLIKKIFPEAIILEVCREPYGHYWSIYKNYFTHGNEFSTAIQWIDEFSGLYKSMLRQWREVLQIDIESIAYEDLVQQPKQSITRLLEICRLEWHEDCLNPQESATPVQTASVYQVRQPIYSTSVSNADLYAEMICKQLGSDQGKSI